MTNRQYSRYCAVVAVLIGGLGLVSSMLGIGSRVVLAFNGVVFGATLPLVWLAWRETRQ